MGGFFRRLKLEESLSTTLQSSKIDFESYLKEIIETGDSDWYSGSTDVFSKSKYIFKGHVYNDGFEIKERTNFRKSTLAKAIGKFSETNGQTLVETKIMGFDNYLTLLYSLILIQFSVFLYDIFSGGIKLDIFQLILSLIFYSLFFTFPIILTRWSIKSLKNALDEAILGYLLK